jgi:hypothetical protein
MLVADERTSRISRLSQRFEKPAAASKTESQRARERQSLYLDAELMKRIDQVHRDVAHQLYPRRVTKSTFLETLLEYSLAHLDEVKSQLTTDGNSQ